MARPSASFNASIGRKRLAASISPETAAYTRSARASMQAIIRNYRKFVANVEKELPEILFEAMVPTFALSQEYCPKDTGKMRESGYLEITSFRGKPRVEIGYGRGGDPEYTAAVHENMEWRHKAPTRAKWLQIALEESAQEVQARIVTLMRV